MWLYYLLKTMSTVISWLPYKAVVVIGKGMGHLYHKIAKKQRVRAEETIRERLGYSQEQAEATIKSLFVKLGITFMEIMYMPALNKDNIRGLVTFDRPEVLWEALEEKHGVVMLACHMDNWEWLGAALALNGLYFLCMAGGSFGFAKGDLIGLACALLFSIHILVIDHFSPLVDGVKMACIQFWVCALVAGVGMLIFEHPTWANILAAWKPILYAGAMSSGVGYTLQIVGQKGMNPAVASLIMSLESVISVIAGWLILDQALSGREIFGCVLMFGAIVLAQLPERKKQSV